MEDMEPIFGALPPLNTKIFEVGSAPDVDEKKFDGKVTYFETTEPQSTLCLPAVTAASLASSIRTRSASAACSALLSILASASGIQVSQIIPAPAFSALFWFCTMHVKPGACRAWLVAITSDLATTTSFTSNNHPLPPLPHSSLVVVHGITNRRSQLQRLWAQTVSTWQVRGRISCSRHDAGGLYSKSQHCPRCSAADTEASKHSNASYADRRYRSSILFETKRDSRKTARGRKFQAKVLWDMDEGDSTTPTTWYLRCRPHKAILGTIAPKAVCRRVGRRSVAHTRSDDAWR